MKISGWNSAEYMSAYGLSYTYTVGSNIYIYIHTHTCNIFNDKIE